MKFNPQSASILTCDWATLYCS